MFDLNAPNLYRPLAPAERAKVRVDLQAAERKFTDLAAEYYRRFPREAAADQVGTAVTQELLKRRR
ncbi:MAG: hypothetical protein JNJ46_09770 [Myxococcales bacterium]|nr:hypothetical protein [Myxococcales bacterium]